MVDALDQFDQSARERDKGCTVGMRATEEPGRSKEDWGCGDQDVEHAGDHVQAEDSPGQRLAAGCGTFVGFCDDRSAGFEAEVAQAGV